MSKFALYSAIAGTGSVGAVAVAVATGLIELPGSTPAEVPKPAVEAAPEVASEAPNAGVLPKQGAEASLVAETAPELEKEPEPEPEAEQVVEVKPDPEAEQVVEVAPEPEAEQVVEVKPEPEAEQVVEVKPEPEAEQVVEVKPEPEAEQVVEDVPKAKDASGGADIAQADANQDPENTVPAPSFDIVRAETDGSTLVAGVATPGTKLEVLVDGEAAESVEVGSDGRFVTFVDLPGEGASSVLSLRNETPDGSALSLEEVIVTPAVPVTRDEPNTLAAASPEKEPDPEQSVAAAQDVSDQAPNDQLSEKPEGDRENIRGEEVIAKLDETLESAEVPLAAAAGGQPRESSEASKDSNPDVAAANPAAPALPKEVAPLGDPKPSVQDGPAAQARSEPKEAQQPTRLMPPTVLLSSARGVEVLQNAPVSPGEVALDSISYDEEGDVLIAGRGKKTASVRVYLDNTPITTSRIREDGRWRVALPEIDTGTYTLRVDQIDESGSVIARVESPFLRESAELLASAASSGDGPLRSITVQPGHTLWEISSNRYGEGRDYVRVFEANRDRIRDPDLIYPGQVFDLPE